MRSIKVFVKILAKKIWRFASLLVTMGPRYTYIKLFRPRLKVLRQILLYLKNGGIRYTYNILHVMTFYGPSNPAIIRWLQRNYPYPDYVEFEPTTRCNLKCIMCEHTYWKEPGKDMTFEQFKHIVDQFPRLKWISPTGIGESFLNKDFVKMLWTVKSRGTYLDMFDSFVFIDREIAEELVNMKCDRIIASIDGATKETYEKIRPGANFGKVINNLHNLIRIKKERKSFFPQVDIHYIISRYNLEEAPKFVELIHSFGKGAIRELRFTRVLHSYNEIKNFYTEVPREIIYEVERKSEELNINMVWGSDVPHSKPPTTHCAAWHIPFIFVTGHVIPCCAENEKNDREFQKKYSMGNIFEQSFKEIWYGEKYTKFRRELFSGKIPIQCQTCPVFDRAITQIPLW